MAENDEGNRYEKEHQPTTMQGTFDGAESHVHEETVSEPIHIVSVLHPKADAENNLLLACDRVATSTEAEESKCSKFVVYRQCYPAEDQPARIIIIERFADQEAFEMHLTRAIVASTMEECNDSYLEKPIDVEGAYVEMVWGFERT